MALFTIEIEGKPIVVLAAENHEEAAEMKEDLAVLDDGTGNPVWNGKNALSVREASPEEVSLWEERFARARQSGDAVEEDREAWAIFLIKIRDPSDNE
jgi:hypothetical protein